MVMTSNAHASGLSCSVMLHRRPAAVWVGGPCNPAGEAEVIATLKAAGIPPASGVLRVGGTRPGICFCLPFCSENVPVAAGGGLPAADANVSARRRC